MAAGGKVSEEDEAPSAKPSVKDMDVDAFLDGGFKDIAAPEQSSEEEDQSSADEGTCACRRKAFNVKVVMDWLSGVIIDLVLWCSSKHTTTTQGIPLMIVTLQQATFHGVDGAAPSTQQTQPRRT
eukprot:scaffold131289_cov21-Tisochrysis_lutea.AAC.1